MVAVDAVDAAIRAGFGGNGVVVAQEAVGLNGFAVKARRSRLVKIRA